MNTDFENQLQRQPIREIPPHWRARILAAAQPPASRWQQWLWPHPRAWAALGAAWVLIFALHFTSQDEPRLARNSQSRAPQSFPAFQEQARLMAQLLSATDDQPAALPAAPKPRSELVRRELIG
jgi:hypothetical protein